MPGQERRPRRRDRPQAAGRGGGSRRGRRPAPQRSPAAPPPALGRAGPPCWGWGLRVGSAVEALGASAGAEASARGEATAGRGDHGAGPRRPGPAYAGCLGGWSDRGRSGRAAGAGRGARHRLTAQGGWWRELCGSASGRAGVSSGGKSRAGCGWAVSCAAGRLGWGWARAHAPGALLRGWVLGEAGGARAHACGGGGGV